MLRLNNSTELPLYVFPTLDFGLEVFKEKIPENGEDSYLYLFLKNWGVAGVFDGCGGSGARQYERFKRKTGAYMASRAVSAAFRDWFVDYTSGNDSDSTHYSELTRRIVEYLGVCQKIGGSATALKGSLSKDFPTTAAVISLKEDSGGINATCLWAGDSRCYLLDTEGLKQLTEDDLGGFDAMENLSADGVLTNTISLSKNFELHHKTLTISHPAILFAATDGCFGYLSTPMEFEYLLLDTLLRSKCVEEWEQMLTSSLQAVAGDDFTLCGFSLGFNTFSTLRNSFKPREAFLQTEYIRGIEEKTVEEKMRLWRKYSVEYSKYLKPVPKTTRKEYSSETKDRDAAQKKISGGESVGDSGSAGNIRPPIPADAEISEHKLNNTAAKKAIVLDNPTDLG